ncbi:hypothetical protein, partial [Arthrobacter sp. H14-L1]|uniref:hypothetical protein n=1 Tax=Arthrobacter sp. H14-L1 TaxID=2996697 RepID=UPI00226F5750
ETAPARYGTNAVDGAGTAEGNGTRVEIPAAMGTETPEGARTADLAGEASVVSLVPVPVLP